MTIRRIFLALTMVLSLCTAGAQEKKPGFIHRTFERLLAPSVELDPEAVYQPKAGWTFALTGDLRQAGISQLNEFSNLSGDVLDTGQDMTIAVNTTLKGDIHKVLGFQVGYGNISLSLGKKIGGDGENSTFSFDYMNAGYALQVQYFKYYQPIEYYLSAGYRGEERSFIDEGVSYEPGKLRALIADAMYSFNRRTFSYSAAYRGNKIQRRSAGSWMFGSKLILSDFAMDPAEEFIIWTGGQARHASTQISFGGGYSYNFVPLHRHPYGDRDKGLRNLTVNLTAMPLVTMFNLFTSQVYTIDMEAEEEHNFLPAQKTQMNGKLKVNYVVRAGIGYSHDLYTCNLSASYDSFGYRGEAIIRDGGVVSNINTTGDFSRWYVSLRIGRRF